MEDVPKQSEKVTGDNKDEKLIKEPTNDLSELEDTVYSYLEVESMDTKLQEQKDLSLHGEQTHKILRSLMSTN